MERDSDDDRIDIIKNCYGRIVWQEQVLKWMQYHKERHAYYKSVYESDKKSDKKMNKILHDSINKIKKPINLEEIEKEIRKKLLEEQINPPEQT